MKLTWLCPTWNRPKCLRNLIAQFMAQDYPPEMLELIILDDAGQYENQSGDDGHGGKRWQLISFKRPFATLGEKYNTLLALAADSDGVVVAEDDDLYLPKHSAACAQALKFASVCKPTSVLVEYGGRHVENDPGRFHASLAMRTEWLRSIGGWPISKRADFDLQMIAKLRANGSFCCPQTKVIAHDGMISLENRPRLSPEQSITFEPTYCFRWETTGHTHAQAYGQGPGDENYLERARQAAGPIEYVGKLFGSVP